jgi:hypothetical protein
MIFTYDIYKKRSGYILPSKKTQDKKKRGASKINLTKTKLFYQLAFQIFHIATKLVEFYNTKSNAKSGTK